MEMQDMTGQPTKLADIEKARTVVGTAMFRDLLKLPPELAVELATIHRCLTEYLYLRRAVAPKEGS